jgi:hypothetical protein
MTDARGDDMKRDLKLFSKMALVLLAPQLVLAQSTEGQEGQLADILVVRGNPLDSIKAARDIKLVVSDGIGYDPAELLRSAKGKIGPAGPDDHADWELEIRPLRRD